MACKKRIVVQKKKKDEEKVKNPRAKECCAYEDQKMPDVDGNIGYDVMFEHGIEKGVSINEQSYSILRCITIVCLR